METKSSDVSRRPLIWFLEALAGNKEIDYGALRKAAMKVPGLTESDADLARELLALRCLEELENRGYEGNNATRLRDKLDLSLRCSVVLFNLTSEVVNSRLGLKGVDVLKWDLKSFVESKRAQLPKCALDIMEEMILNEDPAAVSLREISGIKNVGRGKYADRVDGVAKVVSLGCDETGQHHVAEGVQQVRNSIPENMLFAKRAAPVTAKRNRTKAVLRVDDETDISASTRNQKYDDGPLSELLVNNSRDHHEKMRQPSNVVDSPVDVEGYANEDVDAARLNYNCSQHAVFDWNEPTLCMKCNKGGDLLCCSSGFCSVSVHRDCLGIEPCFNDSGRFRCPFCVSTLATAEYLEAKTKASLRKRELDMYLSSVLSIKLSEGILNKKSRRDSKKDDMCNPMNGHDEEEKDEPNQNVEHCSHINPEIDGDADANPTRKSRGAGMVGNLTVREINNKATGHVDLEVLDEPPILKVKDIPPTPRNKNATRDSTASHPQDYFVQLPLTSDESEDENSLAIVLYEGNTGYDKKDNISQNLPESNTKRVRATRSIPNVTISKPTPNVTHHSYPINRRRKVPWSANEEDKLREGVRTFYKPEEGRVIPWSQILEFGAHVFQPCRTAENLKDKWKNICKKDKM